MRFERDARLERQDKNLVCERGIVGTHLVTGKADPAFAFNRVRCLLLGNRRACVSQTPFQLGVAICVCSDEQNGTAVIYKFPWLGSKNLSTILHPVFLYQPARGRVTRGPWGPMGLRSHKLEGVWFPKGLYGEGTPPLTTTDMHGTVPWKNK